MTENDVTVGVISMDDVAQFRAKHLGLATMTLFGGDRAHCCDEAVALTDPSGEILGLATIAPDGEEGSGVPTIVGLYTVKSARQGARGIPVGTLVLQATIRRCIERGFTKVHIDAMSEGAVKTIARLPDELRRVLQVNVETKMGGSLLD